MREVVDDGHFSTVDNGGENTEALFDETGRELTNGKEAFVLYRVIGVGIGTDYKNHLVLLFQRFILPANDFPRSFICIDTAQKAQTFFEFGIKRMMK